MQNEETIQQTEPETQQLEAAEEGNQEDQNPAGKTLTIPTKAMARIKQEERDRGRKQAEQDYSKKLETLARKLGYKSWQAMEAARSKTPKQKFQRPVKQETQKLDPEPIETSEAKGHPRQLRRLEVENARLLEQKKQANRARAHEERRRRQLERELDAKEAETALRVAAVKAGVHDIDYALHLLRQNMAGKDPESLADFDESKYFSKTLRQSHPYLFSTEERPATTSVAEEVSGKPPTSGAVPKPELGNGKDASKMSADEYKNTLKKLGLSDPSVGMPS